MIVCPYCDVENIVGVDECGGCGQPLADLHLPEPATEIERSLLIDRINVLRPMRPVAVSPETTIGEVLNLLHARSIGCVVVTEEDRLVGIFSERDALHRIGPRVDELRERPVGEFMTRDVHTLDAQAKIAYAVRAMDVGHYRHLPLVDAQGKPVGIISVRDILRYLTSNLSSAAV